MINISPVALAADQTPIKTLRRDESTADVAAIILNSAGLAKAIDLDSISKKSGFAKNFNKIKHKEAKWPNDYIVRLEDDEPQYDTLEVSEFVSGYLSIMEEVITVTPDNAKLLAHLHYLRQLMDDCLSFDWEDVRSTHR